MRKIYLTLIIGLLSFHLSAQRTSSPSGMMSDIKKPVNILKTDAAGCDTIDIPIPGSWNVTFYTAGTGGSNGFVAGVNGYGDFQKARYFDVSSTPNTYLTRVWLGFARANGGNLAAVVPIRVYDGTTGEPGALLATENTTLGDIRTSVLADDFHDVVFSTPVTLPASKKFFVSVDISNLSWNATPKDSLTLYTTTNGDTPNSAWEQWDDGDWWPFDDAWALDLALLIHPFVSDNATCSVLPVTLAKFTGETKGKSNLLRWTTTTEVNNSGFELQRSANGVDFTSIARIASQAENGNSISVLNYSFEDIHPISGTNFYRLKQVDKDNRTFYSDIVTLKSINSGIRISSLFPNPVRDQLSLIINTPSAEKATLVITDLSGKIITRKVTELTAGDNQQFLDVQAYASGTYLIKLICANGCETSVQRFVKH